MEYNFRDIEQKWQLHWQGTGIYKVSNDSDKPKYYVLDMFPYPSGAGLHVGHPLGYIASDIFSRYKRLKGFNVLHPMGYDAFGLPAEQYAIDHGIHPAVSTEANIKNFRGQLDRIGFCYDWDREVNTSKPEYYKWTQWIFLQLFNSFFDRAERKARPIEALVQAFEKEGNSGHPMPDANHDWSKFNSQQWKSASEATKQDILMQYRLAYCGIGEVNWCEALGTVLANDEVINGVSERGGYPVVKKKLRQWYLRITEYADRLIEGLETVDFSDAMKEMQTNWIGKSSGAEIDFNVQIGSPTETHETVFSDSSTSTEVKRVTIATAVIDEPLRVYTTRPDTIFGVDFMVIAPEHQLVGQITTPGQRQAVEEYIAYVNSRSERERMAEKKISGVFTGSYALNPFNKREIPIWISEYVLAGYGTGAIMAVPCGDERDHRFAKHFNIPVTNIIGSHYNGEDANPTKDATLENSGFLNGMVMRDAIDVVIRKIEEAGIGVRKTNYKMRDAAFSRQRYWGEPFPIKWIGGVAHPLTEDDLPLQLPHVDSYKPGPEGEGPLANIKEWTEKHLETNTMPGYAGSSWYFLRYMDPHNDGVFCDRKASDYWGQVDLYIGGTEHAVGHLLYSRMWTKALYDLGLIGHDEPYRKLVNQGMIQGSSRFVYRISPDLTQAQQAIIAGQAKAVQFCPIYVSFGIYERIKDDNEAIREIATGNVESAQLNKPFFDLLKGDLQFKLVPLHVDVNIVNGLELDIEAFRQSKEENAFAIFELEEGAKYICGVEVEKMSKRYFNTVNPKDLCDKYGADTFRMYEMFLGPVEMSKPWDTKGIEGVHRFLKKLWRLFYDEVKGALWTADTPSEAEWKVLHKTIRQIEEATERFSFNTAVSGFMICVNELTDMKCHKKQILEPLLILLTPYAPHVAEELWHQLGNNASILDAAYPAFEAKYVIESSKEYPVSINGKMRTTIDMALGISQEEVEKIVLANTIVQKWLEGKPPKKIIYKEGKMVNVVV